MAKRALISLAVCLCLIFVAQHSFVQLPENRIERSNESNSVFSYRDEYIGLGKERLGSSIAVGDFNGDSYDDLLVGAPYNDVCGNRSGRAYIYFGGPAGLPSTPSVILPQNTTQRDEELLGTSVAAGDLDGDGFDEAILGAPMYHNEYGILTGRVCIFKGSVAMDGRWDRTIDGPISWTSIERFGCALACGDINGDGRDDLLVGANFHNLGLGAAYLYLGKATLAAINDNPDKKFEGISASQAEVGSAVAIGNLNNDSYMDIAIGAPGQQGDSGKLYVYLGAATVQNTSYIEFNSLASGERFGEAVSFGDFNNDGYDDLLIGAPENKLVGTNTGRAYIYYGGHIPNNIVDLQLSNNIAGERFGSAVSSGDLNGDGFSDAIVGAENYSIPLAHSGRTYCFIGGLGMDSVADHILEPTGFSEWFGCAVAAGDFWNASNDAPSVGALAGANDAGKFYVFDKPWIAPLPSPISQDTNLNVTIDLSQYEHSLKYSTNPQALRWWVTSYDPSAIASISGQGSEDDILTFQPVTDYQGHTFVGLLLNDTDGRNASCTLHIYWGGTNIAPTLVDMKLQFYILNRTQTQGIYINATDSGIGADEESALTCTLKYRRAGDEYWTGYGDLTYNTTSARFEAYLSTTADTPCGFYDINFTIRDTMYASSNYEFLNAFEIRNNLPYISPEPPSMLSGLTGDTLYLDLSYFENDVEDPQNLLNWYVESWNESILSIYGQNSTDDNLTFVPNATFSGIVYLTLVLSDKDGGLATWQITLIWSTPYFPSAVSLNALQSHVERTSNITLVANAIHEIENESTLIPQFEYLPPFGDWTPVWGATYVQGLGWLLNITTNSSTLLGNYGARVRFSDSNGNISAWLENLTLFEIVNRPPSVILFSASTSSAFRGSVVHIMVRAIDEHDDASNMFCQVRYRYNGENTWLNLPMVLDMQNNGWTADLTIPKASPIGNMQFETLVTDSDGANSTWQAMESTLTILNNPPRIKPIADPEPVDQGSFVNLSLLGKGEDLETDIANLTWYVSYYDSNAISQIFGQNTTYISILPFASFSGNTTIELTLEDKDGGKASVIINLSFKSTLGPKYKGGLNAVLPEGHAWTADLSLYFIIPEGAQPIYSCSNSLVEIDGSHASYLYSKGKESKLENITFTVVDKKTGLSAQSEKITITFDVEEHQEEPLSMTLCFLIAFGVIALIVLIAIVSAVMPHKKKEEEEDVNSLVKMNVEKTIDDDKKEEVIEPKKNEEKKLVKVEDKKVEEFKQNLSAKSVDLEAKSEDTEVKNN